MNHPTLAARLLVLLLATLSAAPRAELPAPTLSEAVAAGLARYPDLPISDTIRGQAGALRTQAEGLWASEPALVLRHESDAANNDAGYRQWETGVALPLWLPGQRERRLQVAAATERESQTTRRLYAWQVAGLIRDVLWTVQRAAAEQELAQRALHGARDLQADIERRVEAGELARADRLLAQKETLARELDLAAAQSAHSAARAHYAHVSGLDAVPSDILETAAAVQEIPDSHPALAAARDSAARAAAERARVRGDRRANPVLTVGGKSERPAAGTDYASAVVLELNIPFGSRGRAAVDNAAAERGLAEASAQLARVQQELEHDLHNARADWQLADQAARLAAQQQALGAESLRLAQRAFAVGENDLFMLLQARAQALAAERDATLRGVDRGHATARLNQALGVIPE